MDEIEFEVSRERYNEFVQRAQEVALSFRLEHRIELRRATAENVGYGQAQYEGEMLGAEVQIFWDGWRTVASERKPLSPETSRTIYPAELDRITYQAAEEVAR